MLVVLGGLIVTSGAHAADTGKLVQRQDAAVVGRLNQHPDFQARASTLALKSSTALVIELGEGEEFYAKNTDAVVPIASITKLMTAMVVLDERLPLDEHVKITNDDIDDVKGTRSRLRVGSVITRGD
ncbi:MAG: serine hydrolase, partial [Betaproteobacteria bacterium]|nr:serine hydrolase [Betaproteobacteria bacterium]